MIAMPATAEIAEAEFARLRHEATNHKRLAQQHRRESVRIMEARQQLIERCLAAGITVELQAGGTSHGQHISTSTNPRPVTTGAGASNGAAPH